MAVIDELLVGLGFEYDSKELDKFKNDVDKTVTSIKQFATVVISATAALTAFVAASANASDEQGKLADEIGVSVEEIDALEFALKRSGGTAQGMADALRQLSVRAAETARGVGEGIEAFGLLGISVSDTQGDVKSTSDLLLEISDRFKNLSQSRQIELADKLGIRGALRLLQQTPAGIQKLIQEAKALGVTTREDAVISAEFNDSLTDFWQITKEISRVLTRSLAPALTKSNKVIEDWWKRNKAVIELNIPKYVDMATKAFNALAIAAAGFITYQALNLLISIATAVRGVAVAAFLADGAFALLPFALAALGLAFVAATEDAHGFFKGQQSIFGDLEKKYPEYKRTIDDIAAVFDTMATLTLMIFKGWGEIFNLFRSNEGTVEKATPGSAQAQEPLTVTGGLAAIGRGVRSVGEFGGNVLGFLGDVTGISPLETRSPNIVAPTGGNKTSNVNVDTVNVNVNAASGDPKEIATQVSNIFTQTTNDLKTAVDQ
jgi:hypothetical protein